MSGHLLSFCQTIDKQFKRDRCMAPLEMLEHEARDCRVSSGQAKRAWT